MKIAGGESGREGERWTEMWRVREGRVEGKERYGQRCGECRRGE